MSNEDDLFFIFVLFCFVQLFKLGALQSVCITKASGADTGKEVGSFIFVQIM
jgi:hypothetical protein